MNFSALLDQLRDRALELWGRIQETSIYMTLRERFESLNPQIQKLVVLGSILTLVFFLFYWIPYSYVSSSMDHMTNFEENRELIRDLLKASASMQEASPLPQSASASALTSQITRSLEEFQLSPEQLGGVQPIMDKVTDLAPDVIEQVGASVSLKKLNLDQFVNISHKLQTLGNGVKMIGLDIQENASASHYFDVIYRIASFSIPGPSAPPESPKGGRGKGPPPSKKESSDEADL